MTDGVSHSRSTAQSSLKGVDFDNILNSIAPSLPGGSRVAYEFPIARSSWHQLIVIGNGFDLECGLASSFSSFIEARNKEFDKSDQSQDTSATTFTKTIWDVALSSMDGSNWCDIEGAIADWVAPTKGKSKTSKARFVKILQKLSNPTRCYDTSKAEEAAALYLEHRHSDRDSWSQSDLLHVMRDDLAKLESDFGHYLATEVDETRGYGTNADRLMSEIMLDQAPSKDEFDVEESILSFNYTRPNDFFHAHGRNTEYINIHGRLGGEIIFGIDGTSRMDDPAALPFTKTYRLMALDLPDIGKIVRAPMSGAPIAGGTKMIKFYGHSLGEADYSYFQAIFDSVRLYESDTRLVFYFRPHQLPNGEMQNVSKAKKEMMEKVIGLLTAYSLTLDNKDHGKNLIHKLLIEGRLSVSLLEGDACER